MTVTPDDGRTIGDLDKLKDEHINNYAAIDVNVPFYLERFMNYMTTVLK